MMNHRSEAPCRCCSCLIKAAGVRHAVLRSMPKLRKNGWWKDWMLAFLAKQDNAQLGCQSLLSKYYDTKEWNSVVLTSFSVWCPHTYFRELWPVVQAQRVSRANWFLWECRQTAQTNMHANKYPVNANLWLYNNIHAGDADKQPSQSTVVGWWRLCASIHIVIFLFIYLSQQSNN